MHTITRSTIFLLLILFAFPVTALSHTEGTARGTKAEALIVEPDLFIPETLLPIWIEVHNTNTKEHIKDLAIAISVTSGSGDKLTELQTTPKDERYLFEYTFPQEGEYTIHASFVYDSEPHEFEFDIIVAPETSDDTAIPIAILITAAFLALIVLILGIAKKRTKIGIILAILALVAGVLGYSLYETFRVGGPSAGITTCPTEDTCFWVAHIHAFVPTTICNEEHRYNIEVGPLDESHTHEEKNIIHWHDKLPYNPDTQTITDATPLTLGAFFDAIEVYFAPDGILDARNGDLCPDGSEGTLNVFVNGEHNTDFRDYLWSDRDVITIRFDATPPEETETELRKNPVSFPNLGRG